MGIAREVLLRGSQSEWLADQVTRRQFTRRAVERFMPGEELHNAIDAAVSLDEKGIPSILTLLGENVTTEAEAQAVAQRYLKALDRVKELGLDTYVSLKPTQFGLDVGFELCLETMEIVVKRAVELDKFVAIDMESSEYIDRTIELYRHLRSDYEHAVLCMQSYVFRTAADLELLLDIGPTVRLVKGAYKEPPNIAYKRKKDVDASFVRLAERLFEAKMEDDGVGIVFGTHDMRLIRQISRKADAFGIPRDAFEIQMLYGIQREAQLELAKLGFKVRVLISYGPSWFPWYMRRLAERPANILFALKSLYAK
jgi:proline dehydrogenase